MGAVCSACTATGSGKYDEIQTQNAKQEFIQDTHTGDPFGEKSETKSNHLSVKPPPQSNLYRERTDTPWDDSDIEDLREEMQQQIEHMKTQTNDKSHTTNYDSLSLPNIGIAGRNSNLVQTQSCDWDTDELENEEDYMRKQIRHLSNEYEDDLDIDK